MTVICSHPVNGTASRAGAPQTLWQKIAQSVDRLVAQRSQNAVPAVVLRRSRYDIRRCRRLMTQGTVTRAVLMASNRA